MLTSPVPDLANARSSAVAESPNRVSIRWEPAADNGSPITTYRLIRSQNPSMTLFSVTLVDAMVFDLVDLTPSPGTTYYYGVYAVRPIDVFTFSLCLLSDAGIGVPSLNRTRLTHRGVGA